MVSPLCNVLWECIVVLHVNYIVYKHFDWSLHVGSSGPTYVQNFRPAPITFPLLLENKKFFELKSEGYRDGIKRKETR